MDTPSRQQFIEQVIGITRSRFPLVKITPGEQPFSVQVNGHTASLENLYRLSVLSPDDLKHNVERWMVELLRASEGTPDESATYAEVKDRILPMILTERAAAGQGEYMVTQPLVGNVLVAYAVDHDQTIAYISRKQFESWKISPDELHETAINNLVAHSEAINAHAAQDEEGRINLILFQTRDGYDAARILLPTLHERLREHLGSPFAAAIPNRDILLCFRNDEETADRISQQVATDNEQMPHPISDRLFLITADGIAVRDDQDLGKD